MYRLPFNRHVAEQRLIYFGMEKPELPAKPNSEQKESARAETQKSSPDTLDTLKNRSKRSKAMKAAESKDRAQDAATLSKIEDSFRQFPKAWESLKLRDLMEMRMNVLQEKQKASTSTMRMTEIDKRLGEVDAAIKSKSPLFLRYFEGKSDQEIQEVRQNLLEERASSVRAIERAQKGTYSTEDQENMKKDQWVIDVVDQELAALDYYIELKKHER